MRKLSQIVVVFFLACTTFLFGCTKKEEPEATATSTETSTPQASIGLETKGIWFSYLEYRDLYQGMDEATFTTAMQEMITNCLSLDINTIYLHATAFTDSYYDSDIFPRSVYLAGTDYDPFAIILKLAHENGMRVEAWMNPMRSILVEEKGTVALNPIIESWIDTNDERVRVIDGRYYLNPAYTEVRALIVSVEQEILDKYDVDGIHLDDYFYPSGTNKGFDAYIFSEKQKENPEITIEQFRTQNVDDMVKELYVTAKKKSSDVLFGISPAGNIENCITMMYANPSDWVAQGTVDYLIPQIYWGFQHPIKPYEATLQEWLNIVAGSDVKLIVGLAAYKIGVLDGYAGEGEKEWIEEDDLLAREIKMAENYGCNGIAYFSYKYLWAPNAEVQGNVEKEIFNILETFSSN